MGSDELRRLRKELQKIGVGFDGDAYRVFDSNDLTNFDDPVLMRKAKPSKRRKAYS